MPSIIKTDEEMEEFSVVILLHDYGEKAHFKSTAEAFEYLQSIL